MTKTVTLKPGTYTFNAGYTGDTHYVSAAQTIVVSPVRRRAAR